jgi:hypothetical protein
MPILLPAHSVARTPSPHGKRRSALLKPASPDPACRNEIPWGLRASPSALLLFVAFFYSYSGQCRTDHRRRLRQSRPATELPDVRIDAWVTPPALCPPGTSVPDRRSHVRRVRPVAAIDWQRNHQFVVGGADESRLQCHGSPVAANGPSALTAIRTGNCGYGSRSNSDRCVRPGPSSRQPMAC